jgi:hypothetical protein
MIIRDINVKYSYIFLDMGMNHEGGRKWNILGVGEFLAL